MAGGLALLNKYQLNHTYTAISAHFFVTLFIRIQTYVNYVTDRRQLYVKYPVWAAVSARALPLPADMKAGARTSLTGAFK